MNLFKSKNLKNHNLDIKTGLKSPKLPLVTVIAVCYNHEAYVLECLESILDQTYNPIQLIIMDDRSSDRSAEIISKWIKKSKFSCIFIRNERNIGLPKTLNKALSLSRGQFISIISTDDVWLPCFIQDRFEIFSKGDELLGLVYGKSIKIDRHGEIIPGLFQSILQPPEGYVLKDLIKENFIAANSVMMRSSCFEKVGDYDEDLVLEDYDMWIRIAMHFEFAYSPNVLSKYRVLSTSLDHSRRDVMRKDVAKVLIKLFDEQTEFKELIIERLIPYRNYVYSLNHHLASKLYKKSLRKRFRSRDLLLFFLSLIGMPYDLTFRLLNKLKPGFDDLFFIDK